MNRCTAHPSGVSSRFSFAVLAALTLALAGCSTNLLETTESPASGAADELRRGATSPFDGYTLFGPIRSTIIYLVDMAGELAHKWETDYSGGSLYMLESGNLLRSVREPNPVGGFRGGGEGGIVQEIAWDGTVVWEWHAWDHLVQEQDESKANYGIISAHPELIDLNAAAAHRERAAFGHA